MLRRVLATRRNFGRLLLGLLLVGLTGCGRQPDVRTYSVPKSKAPEIAAAQAAPNANPAAVSNPTDRMLVATALRGPSAWFFKLVGPIADVDAAREAFETFIASVKFNEQGQPTWELPAGWQSVPPSAMRFATLKLPGAKLEIAISSLAGPASEAAAADYWRSNIDRWRTQLGLEPVGSESAQSTLREQLAGEQKFYVFDERGVLASGMGPMMGSAVPAAAKPASPASALAPQPDVMPPPPARMAVECEAPKGFAAEPPRAMTTHLFRRGSIEVVLSQFPATAEMREPLANVNRWLGQVALRTVTAETLGTVTEPLQIGGVDGLICKAIPTKPDTPAIVAGMVEHESTMWFFKLSGPAGEVGAELDAFKAWLTTVKFTTAAQP